MQKTNRSCEQFSRSTLLVLAAALALGRAHAADRYWATGSDLWQNGAWSATPGGPGGASPPTSGDNANILSATDLTVTRNNVIGSLLGLNLLNLDGSGAAVVTLTKTGVDTLTGTNLIAGLNGNG